jgi:valyl-tRNA synthetase
MLDKAYNPQGTEDRIYKLWEDSGAFKADVNSSKEPFTISMPPPNATGQLHLGHAVMLALEDIFIRFARMRGKEALWVPGTDHAAIATENVVIKQLREKGMKDPRKELGREALIAKIAEFVEESRGTIRGQVRKMGSSCDWSRERYTFEPALNRFVNEVFKKMHGDGLIYRGHRIVNWDPKLQTTVSDDEIVWVEESVPFYTFKYGPFEIGTVRPETKFGDKYVVMHPDDERYAKYKHGDTFECEWINGPVRATIIKDAAVDPAFGTGVMTITPWHTAIDFEIAERHGLEKEQVIGFDGRLLDIAGEFKGMKIDEARPLIVEKLRSKGLMVKTDEAYVHNKATSQRGGGAIEPQIKLQWFIDVNKKIVPWKGQTMSLKEVMHDVVHHGDITIIPERFNRTYFHWIDNLRDWCISRQIWWGHRVPVFYCAHCAQKKEGNSGQWTVVSGQYVSVQPLDACPQCGGAVTQDEDTLDTWFSSSLWTWSTLIEPDLALDLSKPLEQILKESRDFQKFHPTSVMETGYDIIFFWVARMMLMTTYATGQIPFKTVYLHGLIRTRDGKKMSKSDPSTMIDPLDIIPKYGADALRLSMIVGQSPGNDSRLYEEKIAGYRNFVNKLWNASRFVLMQCESAGVRPAEVDGGQWTPLRQGYAGRAVDNTSLSLADRALLFELDNITDFLTQGVERYQLSVAADALYTFVWDFFCDWYLELSKGEANVPLLVQAVRRILTLLHPFCPFVTEELWSRFKPAEAGLLMVQPWPIQSGDDFGKERRDFQVLIDVITSIRQLRADQGVEPARKVQVTLVTTLHEALMQEQAHHIKRMGGVEKCEIVSTWIKPQDIASVFLPDLEVHLSLGGLVDEKKEKARLEAEQASLLKFAAGIKAKLSNEQFVAKAPPALVEEQKAKLAETEGKLAKIGERLEVLG